MPTPVSRLSPPALSSVSMYLFSKPSVSVSALKIGSSVLFTVYEASKMNSLTFHNRCGFIYIYASVGRSVCINTHTYTHPDVTGEKWQLSLGSVGPITVMEDICFENVCGQYHLLKK